MADETTTPANDTSATPQTQEANSAGTTHAEAKFTQADLDRIAGDTRQKATDAARKKILAELGIEDPDADKALLAEARKRKADELTEAQKADKAREQAEAATRQAVADLEAERKAIRLERRDTAIRAALTPATPKADKVLALLQVQHADAINGVLKDDGTVDATKVTALVDTARKAYPEDFGRGGVGSLSNAGGRIVDPSDKDRQSAAQWTMNKLRNG